MDRIDLDQTAQNVGLYLGPYSPTILKTTLCFFFLRIRKFESNTNSDWFRICYF